MACCIEDQELSRRSSILLRECLNEQILPDGTHVERSLRISCRVTAANADIVWMMPEHGRIALRWVMQSLQCHLAWIIMITNCVLFLASETSIRSARGNYSGLIQQAEKLGIPVNECEPKIVVTVYWRTGILNMVNAGGHHAALAARPCACGHAPVLVGRQRYSVHQMPAYRLIKGRSKRNYRRSTARIIL